ncbi:DUF2075 domain-containing protein [Trueperella bernardiae]|uniref:DNA/RNA helicase domain-containing protein n=1 Tax=Trueperella bernardiae TaxID=59561 RepID=UPI002556F28E|nr:DNA/RNA helicase domain-containing protein [Trueperella bernardiae]WIM07571.1 DUF2075 domain-containing protein [Trueperella bernardiae]
MGLELIGDTHVERWEFGNVNEESISRSISPVESWTEELIRKYTLEYPTIYVVEYPDKNKYRKKFHVYVGETNNIQRRLAEHADPKREYRDNWRRAARENKANVYVIANTIFNKSLTLDIENELILMLSGSPSVEEIHNWRGNPQGDYFTHEKLDEVFGDIWERLQIENPDLFLDIETIKDSALFKASPFHKLSASQAQAKEQIFATIVETIGELHQSEARESASDATKTDSLGKLIHVAGGAGTGKTVLLSSVFADLAKLLVEEGKNGNVRIVEPEEITSFEEANYRNLDVHIVVNHVEQCTVYNQIAKKLQLQSKDDQIVHKPSPFINRFSTDRPVDVVLVDEAHLLLTQGDQGYSSDNKNQLYDILTRAQVVLAIYDPRQVVSIKQYANAGWKDWMQGVTHETIELKEQHRISASEGVIRWIDSITRDLEIEPYPEGDDSYDIKVFDSPQQLHEAIKEKARSVEHGLSRLIASYDWSWSETKTPWGQEKRSAFDPKNLEGDTGLRAKIEARSKDVLWSVSIGDWSLPWNYELEATYSAPDKKALRGKAWAEQDQTINEVGSIYTIQGFDLNVAGVILGKSVTFRSGRIVLDPASSKNARVTNQRRDSGRPKEEVSRELLQNELNVLMTRGVNGLYVYAEDPELREALKASVKSAGNIRI